MSKTNTPTFRELDRDECDAILARNHLGRIAFSFKDRVNVEPVHYVYQDGWIYLRSAPGTKVMTVAHNRWVAFEVDEVEGFFDWRSVVARGTIYLIDPEGSDLDIRAHTEAVELIRAVLPEAFTSMDPAPFRFLVLRIHVDEMTGREASTKGR
jgi:nitroimidazol reductase NimA-like FMN-containing flavoprotein (pyridoxamine 5'-phosphate oxidase superfamily)